MIKLIASYSKKAGLPGYSSHGFHLTVETELQNLGQVSEQCEELYSLLQQSVDQQIQRSPGFVPPDGYGFNKDNGAPSTASNEWKCSAKQKELIEKVVRENRIEIATLEALATDLFGKGLHALNKLEASGLIDRLLEKHGKGNNNGFRRGRRALSSTGGAA